MRLSRVLILVATARARGENNSLHFASNENWRGGEGKEHRLDCYDIPDKIELTAWNTS